MELFHFPLVCMCKALELKNFFYENLKKVFSTRPKNLHVKKRALIRKSGQVNTTKELGR